MTDTTTTKISAAALTADHIGRTVTVPGGPAGGSLSGRLVDLHFTTERTGNIEGGLRFGHIEVVLTVLFRGRALEVEVGPSATITVED